MVSKHISGIDGLRALAVLVVIAYHYFPNFIPFGYLGVDIFFVISGFVITRLIDQWEYKNSKDFLVLFYLRRIRRLAPALVVCVILISVLFLMFTSRPSRELFATGGLSLVGLSNLLLFYLSTDYFALDAHINPFTHTWSLGVEEQFYIFYPVMMLLAGAVGAQRWLGRTNLIIALLLILISYAGYVLLTITENGSMAAFYLTPFRAWELLLGGLSYYLVAKLPRLPSFFYELSSAGIVLLFFIEVGNAILQITISVVLCAIVLNQVSRQTATFSNVMYESRFMGFIGNRSYSLYLYHWPILVLASLTIGTSAAALTIALVFTIIVSSASYSYVENPFRTKQLSWTKEKTLAASVIGLAGLSAFTGLYIYKYTESHNGLLAEFYNVPMAEPLKSYRCVDASVSGSLEEHVNVCLEPSINPASKRIILIGDSHAAQYFEVFSSLSIESERTAHYVSSQEPRDFPWAQMNNAQGEDRVKALLESTITSQDLLVVAFHKGHFNRYRDLHIPIGDEILVDEKTSNFLKNSREWFAFLEEKGVRVLLILDSPLLSYITSIETCYLQKQLFGETSCSVSYEQDLHTRTRQEIVFRALQEEFELVSVYDPLPILFQSDKYFDPITSDHKFKMVDWNHLSPQYSSVLAPSMMEAVRLAGESGGE